MFGTEGCPDNNTLDSYTTTLSLFLGLEIVTIQETEGLTLQLYKWIETAEEPLTSYATGWVFGNFS